MSAKVFTDGKIVQLDGRAEPDEVVTEQDVQDAPKLSKLLIRILREVAALRRLWSVRKQHLDFHDVVLDATGTTLYRFPHRFNGLALGYVVRWSGAAAPNIRVDATTDSNTLVLTSTSAGTATIRVEEAG